MAQCHLKWDWNNINNLGVHLEQFGRVPFETEAQKKAKGGTIGHQYARDVNESRRHETPTERALIAAKLANVMNGSNQFVKKEGPAIAGPSLTVEKAALIMDVPLGQVEKAKRILRDGTPQVIKAVEEGEMTINAAVEEINTVHLERFGTVRFEIAALKQLKGGTQKTKFARLNKLQSALLATFCRNTPSIEEFKVGLILKMDQMVNALVGGMQLRNSHHDYGKRRNFSQNVDRADCPPAESVGG